MNPYEAENIVPTTNPYELQNITPDKGVRLDATVRTQVAMFNSEAEQKDLLDTYEATKYNSNAQFDALSLAEAYNEGIKQYRVEQIASTGDVAGTFAAIQEPADPFKPPEEDAAIAYQVAQVASDREAAETGDIDYAQVVMDELEWANNASQFVSGLRDDGTLWDLGWDVLSDFVVGDDAFDLTSVMQEYYGEDFNTYSGSTIDALKTLRKKYLTSNVAQKKVIFQGLYAAAKSQTDDPVEQAKILQMLLEEDVGEARVDQVFSWIDSVALAGPLVTGFIKAVKAGTTVSKQLKAVNSAHVEQWINRAINDPELAATINSTPQELTNLLQPWRTKADFNVFPEPAVAKAVITGDIYAKYHKEALRQARLADNFGWTFDEQKAAAQAQADAYKAANAQVNTITVVDDSITDRGFLAEITSVGQPANSRVRRAFRFTVDDITGDFKATPVVTSTKYVDPEAVFAEDAAILVRGLTQAQDARALAHKFAGARLVNFKKAVAKSRNTKEEVYQALIDGAEAPTPTVWNWTQLHNRGLDNMAKAAYYSMRQTFDDGWKILNTEEINRLRSNGFKKLSFNNGQYAAKEITSGYNDKLIRLDLLGNPKTVSRADVTGGRLPANSVVVRLEKPYIIGNDAFTQAVVDRAHLSDWRPRDKVVPYTEAYFPRIRKGVNYTLRRYNNKRLNGSTTVTRISHETLETFSNKKLADDSLANWRRTEPGSDFEVVADREYGSQVIEEGFGGQQYIGTGSRSSRFIPHDGQPDFPMEDPVQSAARYFQMLDNRSILPRWRAGVKKRLLTTAGQYGWKGNPTEVTFDNWRDYTKLAKNDPKYKELDARAKYVTEMIGTKSSDELKAETRLWRLAGHLDYIAENNTMIRKGAQFLANTARTLHDTDIPAFIRAVTFHPTLGWFGVSQLFMQAQGMMIPFLANPGHFIKNIDNIIGLSLLDARLGGKVPTNILSSLGQHPKNKIEAIANMWNKSGFREAVMHNDDLRRASLGMDFAGDPKQKLRNLSAYPFKAGELWNRRAAFTVAYDKLAKEMGVKILPDDMTTLTRVKNKAYDLMTNMQSANASDLQKGAKGVFFQFQQVWMKGLTNFLPFKKAGITRVDGLSNAERSRVMIGLAMLYGAAGIPLGDVLLHNVMKLYNIEEPTREDAQAVEFMYGGVTRMLTGMDMSKYAHMNVEGMDWWRLFTNGMDFGDFVDRRARMPALSVGQRALNATSSLWDFMFYDLGQKEEQYSSVDTWDKLAVTLTEFAKISSDFNRFDKARWLHKSHAIWNNKGEKMVEIDDPTFWDLVLTGLGIPYGEEDDYWVMKGNETDWQREKTEVIDLMMKVFNNPDYDYTTFSELASTNGVIAAKLAGYSPEELADLEKSFHAREWNARTKGDHLQQTRDRLFSDEVVKSQTPTLLKMQTDY